jgi:hypothetical protein
MSFDDLQPELAKKLASMVDAQKTGMIETRMYFRQGQGVSGRTKAPQQHGDERMIETEFTREELRELEHQGYLELNTPRSDWTLQLTGKALAAENKHS